MSSPLIDQNTTLVSFKVTINEILLREEFQVVTIEVEKKINKLPFAYLEILDGDPSEQKQDVMDEFSWKPGMKVKIELGYNQDVETVFDGIITRVGFKAQYQDHGVTQIECADNCVALTLTRDNQYFHDKKDSEIVKNIVQTYDNIECDVDVTQTVHPKIIQYNTSDWDFILSRAKACERIVVAEDNKIKFVKPATTNCGVVLTYGTDIIDLDLDVDGRNQRKKITVKGWDASNHSFKEAASTEPSIDKQGSDPIRGDKLADELQFKEETLYASSQLDTKELKDIANSKLLHSRLTRIRGKLVIQGMTDVKVNTKLTLEKVHEFYEGDVYITGVKHTVEQGNFKTEAIVGLDVESFDPETTTGSTPDNMGLLPGPRGLFVGEVTKMDGDPDNDFRVSVKIPAFSEGDEIWARLSGVYAGKEGGFIWYPEVGDQVILGFIMNDPRFPVILGSLYSKTHSVFDDHQPAGGNNQKAIVTRSHLKILFEEDKKDITIITPNENFLKIMDSEDKIHLEDKHGNKIVMDSSGILIDSPKKITVKAGREIDMDAVGSFTAKGSSIELKGKSGTAKLEAASSVTVKGMASATLEASGSTTVKGLPVKIN